MTDIDPWRDRWTGTRRRQPPSLPPDEFPGRWEMVPNRESVWTLNGIPVTAPTRLLPGPEGRLHWQAAGRASPPQVTASADLDVLLEDTLLELHREIQDRETDWGRLTSLAPLLPKPERETEAPRLLTVMARSLCHLEAIAREPYHRLDVHEEREPLQRVKRSAPRAPLVLATHGRDWDGLTVRGPRPRRLLARQVFVQLNIYENRVAARLIDRLLEWVRQRASRMARLRRGMDRLQEEMERSRNLLHASHRAADRLYRICGEWYEAWKAGDGRHRIERAIALIQEFQTRLEILRGSLLYRSIPRTVEVDLALRDTNLLTDHPRYRHVRLLWNAWLEEHRHQRPSPLERHHRREAVARAMDGYVHLLVARALNELHLRADPVSDDPRTIRWVLRDQKRATRGLVEVEVDRDDGAVTLRRGGRGLRLVPFASTAVGRLPPHHVAEVTSVAVALEADESYSMPDARDLVDPTRVPILRVSPWSLPSIERIGRLLFWWLHGEPLSTWPPRGTLPRSAIPDIVPPKVRVDPITTEGRVDVLLAGIPTPRDERELDRLLKKGGDEAKQLILQLFRQAEDALRCPVCERTEVAQVKEDRGEAGFVAECPGCGARWGLYACPDCRRPFPRLDTGSRGDLAAGPEKDLVMEALASSCLQCAPRP